MVTGSLRFMQGSLDKGDDAIRKVSDLITDMSIHVCINSISRTSGIQYCGNL